MRRMEMALLSLGRGRDLTHHQLPVLQVVPQVVPQAEPQALPQTMLSLLQLGVVCWELSYWEPLP